MDLDAVSPSFWYTDLEKDVLFYHDLRSYHMKTVRLNGAGFEEVRGAIRRTAGVSERMIRDVQPHTALTARIWPFVTETYESEKGAEQRTLTLRMSCRRGLPGKSNLAGVKAMSKYNARYLQLYDQWKQENPGHANTTYTLGEACSTNTHGLPTQPLAFVYTPPGETINWGDERKSVLVVMGEDGLPHVEPHGIHDLGTTCTDSTVVRRQFPRSVGCEEGLLVTHWMGCNAPESFLCYERALPKTCGACGRSKRVE